MKHRRLRETKQGLHRVLSDWRPRSTAGGSRAAAGSNRWIETAQTHTSGHHGGPRGGGDNRRTAVGWIQILTGSYGLRGGHEAPLKTPRRDSTAKPQMPAGGEGEWAERPAPGWGKAEGEGRMEMLSIGSSGLK